MKLNKRILSLILAVVMVLGMFPLSVGASGENEIQIYQGGSVVSAVEFPVNKTVSISARETLGGTAVSDIQWQIQAPGTDTWVSIYGENHAELTVSYAMISNMANASGMAHLRCRGMIDGEEAFSDDISVKAVEAVHAETKPVEYVPAAAPVSESEKAAEAAWGKADAKQSEADAAYEAAEAAKAAAAAAATAAVEAESAAAAAAEAAANAAAVAEEKSAAAAAAKAAHEAAPSEETEVAMTAAAAEAEAAAAAAAEAKTAAEAAAAAAAAAADAKVTAEAAAADAEAKYEAAQAEADAVIDAAAQLTDLVGGGMATFGGRTVAQTYEIRIDYKFENGNTAAESFVRNVQEGSDYALNVPSPVIAGYTANQTQIEETIKGISENKTYTVTYSTNIVDFKVHHMHEKADGSGYEKYEETTHSGSANGPIGSGLAKNTYDGFAAAVYDASQVIMADGSTVVEIKYDRLYYVMSFDLSGGYGVEPIYARYGSAFPTVAIPQRAGYAFTVWSPVLPSAIPLGNTTYTAQWQMSNSVNVNLVFWYENANDNDFTYVGSAAVNAAPGTKIKPETYKNTDFDGRDRYHFTFDSSRNGEVEVAADGTTIVNVYFKRKTYRLAFFNCTKHGVNEDSKSCYPSDGDDALKFVEDGDLTSFNKITMDYYGKSYKDHYNGYNQHYHKKVTSGSKSWNVDVYIFKWQQDIGAFWHGGIAQRTNTRRWKPYKVSGEAGNVIYGGDMNVSMMHVMPDADIAFWFEDEGDYTCKMTYWVTPIPGQSTSGLTTNKNNGTTYIKWDSFSTKMGAITEKEEYVDIEGFTKVYTWKQIVANYKHTNESKKEITADFFYKRNSYNLDFYSGGKKVRTQSMAYEQLLAGLSNENKTYVPTYPTNLEPGAYKFAGWYISAKCETGTEVDWKKATMPVGGMSLYAKWEPVTHTVTTRNEETDTTTTGTYTATHNTVVSSAPANPTKEGYTFVSWFYKDEEGKEVPFNFDMIVTKDLELYAKWRKNDTTEGNYAPVLIGHYLQDLDNPNTYTPAVAEIINSFETIGEAFSEAVGTYPGFVVNVDKSTENGTTLADGKLSGLLTADGLELKIYYDRVSYPYVFRFLEEGTDKVLAEPVTGEAKFGATVSCDARTFAGYELIGDVTRSMTIAVEDNVVTFYYKPMYTTLTITKSGADTTKDENQSFIFNVVGDPYDEDVAYINMNIVITGNGTKTIEHLPVGEYTVTEITEWSWRYTPGERMVRVVAADPDTIYNAPFENERTNIFWLSGDSFARNWFNGSKN